MARDLFFRTDADVHCHRQLSSSLFSGSACGCFLDKKRAVQVGSWRGKEAGKFDSIAGDQLCAMSVCLGCNNASVRRFSISRLGCASSLLALHRLALPLFDKLLGSKASWRPVFVDRSVRWGLSLGCPIFAVQVKMDARDDIGCHLRVFSGTCLFPFCFARRSRLGTNCAGAIDAYKPSNLNLQTAQRLCSVPDGTRISRILQYPIDQSIQG